MPQLFEGCMQNTSYSTVKTPPSLKKIKLRSQKPRLMQKPCIGFFQLHKDKNKREQQLRPDFLLDGFQTAAVWHMLPKQ